MKADSAFRDIISLYLIYTTALSFYKVRLSNVKVQDIESFNKEVPRKMAKKASTNQEVKIGDFIQRGRYAILVALLCELMIFTQLGNMLFMMFSG